jgi:hypothetical protein
MANFGPTQTKETSGKDKSLWSTILIAVLGGAIGYGASFITELYKDRTTVIDDQIQKLYAPLYSLTRADEAAWNQFQKSQWPDRQAFFPIPKNLDQKSQTMIWRRWMEAVFQPLNERREDAIINNAQLVIGGEMSPVFSSFLAHVEAYKVLIVAWKAEGDKLSSNSSETEANVPLTQFPDTFNECVQKEFEKLKARQKDLHSWSWATMLAPFESGELPPDPSCEKS